MLLRHMQSPKSCLLQRVWWNTSLMAGVRVPISSRDFLRQAWDLGPVRSCQRQRHSSYSSILNAFQWLPSVAHWCDATPLLLHQGYSVW
jgi:hypothetical protein